MKTLYSRLLCFLLAIPFIITLSQSVQAQQVQDSSNRNFSAISPEELIERGHIQIKKTTRTFRPEKFIGLRKRYQTIEGIVMIGVINLQGEVLLKGSEVWSPPGGAVKPGENWEDAARRIIKNQTGAEVKIERPLLVERMQFQKEGAENANFEAYILHLKAKPVEEDSSLIDHPEAGNPPGTFKWFHNIPENAHPNHIEHIKLYLDS